jgi:hypothetical protein
MRIAVTPYLTTFDAPFGSGDITDPTKRVIICTDIGKRLFNEVEIEGYFKNDDGRAWWEDGMQSEICHTMHIFTDDPEEGLFSGFCAMNHRDYFMLLGKLKTGDLTRQVLRSFCHFLSTSPARLGKRRSAR